jgi:hypothetical protein
MLKRHARMTMASGIVVKNTHTITRTVVRTPRTLSICALKDYAYSTVHNSNPHIYCMEHSSLACDTCEFRTLSRLSRTRR